MYHIYNGRLVEQDDFKLEVTNRAFQFGDGLFETIIAKNNTIQHLSYHFDRLTEGLLVLQMDHQFNLDELRKQISQLIEVNNVPNARIKLQVWRGTGGLFTPTNKHAEYLLTTQEYNVENYTIEKCSFSEKAIVAPSSVSKFKTCSALPYIMAGIEKKNRNLDELIILNNEGFIAECISSNIFWYKDNNYFTPSLATGCVDGIMRRHIIMMAGKNKIPLHSGSYQAQDLLEAESIFVSNVTGCYPIRFIDNYQFSTEIPIIPLLEL